MEIVTRDGCPSNLYIELTTLTDAGVVVGYTNDSVSGLRSGETAKMTFENTDENASKARLSNVSCY
jgi:hypothetical protein